MSKENTAGLGVDARYGPVAVPDGCYGVFASYGALNHLVAEFSGQNINDSLMDSAKFILPPGCFPVRAWMEVETAFSCSGTNVSFCIGTQGSLGTDSAEVTQSAAAVALYTATLKGKWSTGLTATTTVVVGIVRGACDSQGKGRFVVEYTKF